MVVSNQDLMGSLIVCGMFTVLIVVAELWRRLAHPNPEWSRKLVHLLGGGICIFFPLLIHSPWVVLVLSLLFSGIFAWSSHTRLLTSLTDVPRRTKGSEFYPLAIFIVFMISRNQFWMYLSSILVLAVADAFAALIGTHYGRFRYEVENEKKSLEGSLVFLLIAFLVIHLSLLLLSDLPRGNCVLSALLVAMVVTGFEAISLNGSDNLFVPVGVAFILTHITTKPLPEIIFQNLSLISICVTLGIFVRQVRSFNLGGALALILFTYGVWSLGSWLWALPVFTGFLVYGLALIFFQKARNIATAFKVRIVAATLIGPFILVMANLFFRSPVFDGAYLALMSVLVTFLVWKRVQLQFAFQGWGKWGASALLSASVVLAVVFPPWWLHSGAPASLLAILALTLLSGWLDAFLSTHPEPVDSWFWNTRRIALLGGATLLHLGLNVFHAIPNWAPL